MQSREVEGSEDTQSIVMGPVQVNPSTMCNWCKKKGSNLKRCSRCKTVKYCDQHCQRKDFKEHKIICVPPSDPSGSSSEPVASNNPSMDNLAHGRHQIMDSLDGYEMDIAYNLETDLHDNRINCKKNPGHINFIPVPNFNMDHLWDPWKEESVFETIQDMIHRTVKLKVKWVSKDRPPGAYLYDVRGSVCPRVGTGWVELASKMQASEKVMPCPCQVCAKSSKPEELWYHIVIVTAKHIVYDTSEALQTVVEIGHDDDKSKILRLKPHLISKTGDSDDDNVHLNCALHKLNDYLLERDLQVSMRKMYPKSHHPLAVVVLHPHGCAKVVSLGTVVNVDVVQKTPFYELVSYKYDTPTCPGSSGAFVWIAGARPECSNSDLPHSRCAGGKINESAQIIEFLPAPAGALTTTDSRSVFPTAYLEPGEKGEVQRILRNVLEEKEEYISAMRVEIASLQNLKRKIDTASDSDVEEIKSLAEQYTENLRQTEAIQAKIIDDDVQGEEARAKIAAKGGEYMARQLGSMETLRKYHQVYCSLCAEELKLEREVEDLRKSIKQLHLINPYIAKKSAQP